MVARAQRQQLQCLLMQCLLLGPQRLQLPHWLWWAPLPLPAARQPQLPRWRLAQHLRLKRQVLKQQKCQGQAPLLLGLWSAAAQSV